MKFECRDFGAPDLVRRGLTASSAPPEILLVDTEAALVISAGAAWCGARRGFRSRSWPAISRAVSVSRTETELTSRSVVVRRARSGADRGDGRSLGVGSVYSPDAYSTPVTWESLVQALVEFIEEVRSGVSALGSDPRFIPRV